jgi:hypothetical protein
MEETVWENYGTGRNPKCDNCMVHCGFEATAVNDTVANPLKALGVFLKGSKTDGDMAPELPTLYKEDELAKKSGDVSETKSGKSCSSKQVA